MHFAKSFYNNVLWSSFFACGHWPAAGLVVASEIWRKCHGSKFKKFKNLGNLTNNLKMWYNTKVFGHIILIFWHSLFLPLRLFGGCRNANIFAILAVVWRKCHLVCGGSDYPLPPNYRQSLAVGVGHLSHWANFEQLAVRIKMLKCRRLPREFSSCFWLFLPTDGSLFCACSG